MCKKNVFNGDFKKPFALIRKNNFILNQEGKHVDCSVGVVVNGVSAHVPFGVS